MFHGDYVPQDVVHVALTVLLQFVVENDAKVSASLALDLCGCLLIEPVEVGIVMSFAGFGESVVKRLRFADGLRLSRRTMGRFLVSFGTDGTRLRAMQGSSVVHAIWARLDSEPS
jgi:hypothetical protein